MSISDRERWLSSPPSAFNRYCRTVAQAGTRSPLLQWPTADRERRPPWHPVARRDGRGFVTAEVELYATSGLVDRRALDLVER